LEKAEAKISELTTKVEEQQKLISKLEEDILKAFSFLNSLISDHNETFKKDGI
jgi:hypothetical protein